jgi:hypothetical protein
MLRHGFFRRLEKENINMPDFRFRREVDKNFTLLGYYASSSNFLPTFWDKPSVPSSGVKNPNKWLL